MAKCNMTVMHGRQRKFRLCENEATVGELCASCHASEEAMKGYNSDETPEELVRRLWPATTV